MGKFFHPADFSLNLPIKIFILPLDLQVAIFDCLAKGLFDFTFHLVHLAFNLVCYAGFHVYLLFALRLITWPGGC